jgi:hypothetical protein
MGSVTSSEKEHQYFHRAFHEAWEQAKEEGKYGELDNHAHYDHAIGIWNNWLAEAQDAGEIKYGVARATGKIKREFCKIGADCNFAEYCDGTLEDCFTCIRVQCRPTCKSILSRGCEATTRKATQYKKQYKGAVTSASPTRITKSRRNPSKRSGGKGLFD